MTSDVINAFLKACLLWVLIYVGLAHCFVVWNWNATDGSPPTLVTSLTDQKTAVSSPPKEFAPTLNDLLTKYNLTQEDLDDLIATTPVQPLELIPLNEEHASINYSASDHDVVIPIQDNRQDIQRQIEEFDALVRTSSQEVENLREHAKALESANLEMSKAVAEIDQRFGTKQPQEEEELNSVDNIWQLIDLQIQDWHKNMPSFGAGRRGSPAAMALEKVLTEIVDLSQLSSHEIQQQRNTIKTSLDRQIKFAGENIWLEMTRVLRNDTYPKKVNQKQQNDPLLVCHHEIDDDVDDEEQEPDIFSIPDDAVTEKDVLLELENLKTVLEESYEDNLFPVVTSEGRSRLVGKMETLLQEWAGRVEALAQTNFVKEQAKFLYQEQNKKKQKLASTSAAYDSTTIDESEEEEDEATIPNTCIQREQVFSLLDTGLQALERKQDLRRSLLTAMSLIGIDTSRIILDAVLDSDGDDIKARGMAQKIVSSSISNNPEINFTWRQVLDRPWTKAVTQSWLPLVVDVIGGYNDSLDQWLDETIPVDSLLSGETLSHLLDYAGQHSLSPSMLRWFFFYVNINAETRE